MTTSDSLRQYEERECGQDGYPFAWHRSTAYGSYPADHSLAYPAIKDLIREQAGHRCLRCGHPYRKGEHGSGEWSPCDERCRHWSKTRAWNFEFEEWIEGTLDEFTAGQLAAAGRRIEAQWRILTVHHLDEDKTNRWWNLAALCQRCHLRMQRAVVVSRSWHYEHSDWFKPYAAGFYAFRYLGKDLTHEETMARLDELLALEHRWTQETLVWEPR